MSIHSSAPSAKSFLSPRSNGSAANDGQPSAILASYTAAYTKALPSSRSPHDSMNLNPDELFTKHTVAEVRTVQQRLRADAEAKQEELRLMVGERYRDLLQASSSIIAIAKSSRHVLEAIEESRDSILSQNDLPPPPKTAMVDGVDDRHLHTLQVLSAHMKLLLDAPEHLWRLIERKKYLQAAWLFLLARVVHRALVHQDENDEQSWMSEGVDVTTDFPLVQRQWEVVSQFRSQIIHKSTLSLREITASTEETCATLVTLHLLDSRPLNETLAALLSQRAKTLQAILAWKAEPKSSNKENGNVTLNGHVVSTSFIPVREITQVMKNALGTIAQTISAARAVFHHGPSDSCLIDRVLESIQAENSEASSSLPAELQLSTQSLLAQLTSSANFQLLPSDLRSYKPYVDVKSSSSVSLTQPIFKQRLQEWFESSSAHWQTSATKWFSRIQTVKEVWTARTSVGRSIATSGLDEEENIVISSNVDSLCHDRILDIWKSILLDAGDEFKTRLQSTGATSSPKDTPPAEFLFAPPPIPVLSQSAKTFVDTPFQKYQLALKRQLVGRSSRLDDVLSTLEQCARTIQNDFAHVRGSGDDKTKPFVEGLAQTYQPVADSLSARVVKIVNEATIKAVDNPEAATEGLVFLSRVTDNLLSTSSFIENVGCSHGTISDFRDEMTSMNDKALEKWRSITVKRIIHETQSQFMRQAAQPSGPSPALLRSLLSICECLRQLGVVYHPVQQGTIVQDTLRDLFTSLVEKNVVDTDIQSLHDLAFLRKMSTLYGQSWTGTCSILDEKLNASLPDDANLAEINDLATEYLARTQTMFSLLLPLPPTLVSETPLLQFGTPSVGQTFSSAIDLAKPSPRFGMLLVGNTDR